MGAGEAPILLSVLVAAGLACSLNLSWLCLFTDSVLPGCSFVTGGEDGYVRLQHFDTGYFNLISKPEL